MNKMKEVISHVVKGWWGCFLEMWGWARLAYLRRRLNRLNEERYFEIDPKRQKDLDEEIDEKSISHNLTLQQIRKT